MFTENQVLYHKLHGVCIFQYYLDISHCKCIFFDGKGSHSIYCSIEDLFETENVYNSYKERIDGKTC